MTDLTELEHRANEEARHGNREALSGDPTHLGSADMRWYRGVMLGGEKHSINTSDNDGNREALERDPRLDAEWCNALRFALNCFDAGDVERVRKSMNDRRATLSAFREARKD